MNWTQTRTKKILITWGMISILCGSTLAALQRQEPTQQIQAAELKEETIKTITKEMGEEIEEATEAAVEPILEVAQETIEEIEEEEPILSPEDQELIMRVAQAEAGNQGPEGIWLVECVIWNRIQSPNFPGTAYEVVTQPHQFATVKKGTYKKVKISQEARDAMDRILEGDIAKYIIGFETTESQVLDEYFEMAFQYRDHTFYVEKE